MKSALGALFGCALSGACFATNLNIVDYGATPDDYNDDDAIAINAAINAARDGDVVIVPEGTFHIRETINLKSNVSLKGEGYAKSGIAALFEGDDPEDIVLKGKNVTKVTISGLRLKTNLSGGVKALVYIKNSSDVTIDDASFHRFKRHGVYFSNTVNGKVLNSKFQEATEINTGGYGYGVVYTDGCEGGRVENSDFNGPDIRHGVVVQGGDANGPSHGVVIRDNRFVHTAQDAIDLHGYGEYGNYVMYNTIQGDPDSDTIGRGIGVGEDVHGPSGSGNVIKYNIIRDTRYGIHVLTGSPNVTIRYNEIYDCKRYGIYIQNGPDADIRDNKVEGCEKWGIYVEKGDNTVIRKAETGNQVHNNGLGGSSFGGVRVDADNSGLDIQDNDFCNNESKGGVNLSFAGQGTVKNNLCQ
ncbi:right-handed parallel beta-helix repeat-containing protein [Hahella sp. KA22]|uniref:right-handed parallel beta-helix repeat-containing protein n=1 Tax=Hahella sp. KA22 TaxID=1628392 RepID=UPI000FDF629B|nr:right-handed parallel beta-helix repeat-containing protein [Hahella sp. KA22]AZZ93878.1 right-handed parallel beta-helix repeat-containing protein [Hahella sp. KA22]QAY57251.1 right-handed parallel beta-helix repeat-containing protein [Hahella sp. KA22]